MSSLHAYTSTLRPVVQGMRIGRERCWMRARRRLNERIRDAGFGRELRAGKKTRSKKKSLRPELNWGPTG